jgi:hypothetical protein
MFFALFYAENNCLKCDDKHFNMLYVDYHFKYLIRMYIYYENGVLILNVIAKFCDKIMCIRCSLTIIEFYVDVFYMASLL